jgi:hypothetical protein
MEGGDPISKEMAIETRIAREDQALNADILELGPPRPIPVRSVTGPGPTPEWMLHPLSLPYGPCVFTEQSPSGRDAIPRALPVEHAPHQPREYTPAPASGPTRA